MTKNINNHVKPSAISQSKLIEAITPLQEFAKDQSTSGILLFACAISAVLLANSTFSESYELFFQNNFGIVLGDNQFVKTLNFWINDGLMTLFFFLLGLEIKRSLLAGDLRNKQFATLIAFAAVGGACFPALIYYFSSQSEVTTNGWGIPIATDTAFALGALALLGNRIPRSLVIFLAALAIVDDIFAVSIIGFFYTEQIHGFYIALSFLLVGLLIVLNYLGVRGPIFYIIPGLVLWYWVYRSGIHPTIAGILIAFIIPARPVVPAEQFVSQTEELMHQFEKQVNDTDDPILADDIQHELVEEIENSAKQATTPLQRWQNQFELPVALLILPIFALANAGVNIANINFESVVSNWVMVGISVGLVLGKLTGISLFAWLCVKLKLGGLPSELNFEHIIGVSFLCGIGFTMSIYISNLAFIGQPTILDAAKFSILIGSLFSGVLGLMWFLIRFKPIAENHV